MTAHHRTSEWARARRLAKPVIAASLPAPCIDCGFPVYPDQKWHVGHRTPVAVAKRRGWTEAQTNHPSNLGATHGRCNTSAGGRLAHQLKPRKPASPPNPEYVTW